MTDAWTWTRRTLALALLGLVAVAAEARPALWEVEGRGNRVFLFGSVHVLPRGGFAIEGPLADAFAEAESVCLEVDTSQLPESEVAALTLARAIDPEGRTLFDLLGADADRARAMAAMAGVELAPFAQFEPWFVGLTVALVALQQHGFDVEHGVETIIEQAADRDGKKRCGLETLDQQLGFLDGLEPGMQHEILLQTLAEASDIETEMQAMLAAWQDGDIDALAQQLEEDFEDYPGLDERLIYERNARWAEQLEAMLDGGDDVLLVVGALHLAGPRGLPALLERRGFKVRRR
ncbi:MAG TPA: TraB/GumN family protein [Steroidobacteraceae bacterium]|nr:TraB/GumN family protein [Steroidobacteraceae bacterium]